MERLNKVIAASGIASRRHADDLIREGKVAVNGTIVTELGVKVEPGDKVTVNGKLLPTPKRVTYALYKPRGVVTSRSQQFGDRIITDLLPKDPPVYPVGRLDKDSEGLILLTNDGALADRLTHPKFEHEKEYKVIGTTTNTVENIQKQLLRGVRLGDGPARADKLSVNLSKNGILELVITVHEGRHHLIRRMCASIDVSIDQLIRTRVSGLLLGTMKPGEWHVLSASEQATLA